LAAEAAMLLACLSACAGTASAANTWPISEGTCLDGVPWAEEGRVGCSLMAPSISDVGRPIEVLTGAGERYIYVVEQSYGVSNGGGEYPTGTDGIVQLSNGGAGDPPQFISCVSESPTPNCSQIPNAKAIHRAQSAVLSPNGEYLYVASLTGIASFKIESSGKPQYQECVGLEGGACEEIHNYESSAQSMSLAIADDGRDLYVTGEGTLTDFHIGANGAITLGECDDLSDACSSRRVPEGGFGAVAVTPNGGAVVSAFEGGNVDVYRRGTTGSLTLASCLSASDAECSSVSGSAMSSLIRPNSIAIAPNGRDIYVSGLPYDPAESEVAIAHLRLTEQDTLEFVGCTGSVDGCEPLPPTQAPWLRGADGLGSIAVTPDGAKLLVDGVAVFAINRSAGDLSFESCEGYSQYCAPGELTEGGGILELTPNGKSVWAQSAGGRTVKLELGVSPSSEGKPPPQAGAVHMENVEVDSADASASAHTYGLPTNLWFEIEEAGGKLTYAAEPHGYEHEIESIQATLRLTPGTRYRVRLVAMNAAGTSDGPWLRLKTEGCDGGGGPSSDAWPYVLTSATSITVIGDFNPHCLPTKLTLEVGTTKGYGKIFTVPKSRLSEVDREKDYFIEASGLAADTTYYFRLIARNWGGMRVLEESLAATGPGPAPAAQASAQTGSERAGEAGSAIVEGTLTAGGTPVSAEAQVFDEPEDRYKPSQTFALGQFPADTRAVAVSGSLAGLKCGHTYEWLLAAHTPYGESLGLRKPLLIPCG
jgi:hypothetical protein